MLFSPLMAFAGLGAAATVATSSVKGSAFDRFVVIYFENQNYAKAFGDREYLELYRERNSTNTAQPTSAGWQRRASP